MYIYIYTNYIYILINGYQHLAQKSPSPVGNYTILATTASPLAASSSGRAPHAS